MIVTAASPVFSGHLNRVLDRIENLIRPQPDGLRIHDQQSAFFIGLAIEGIAHGFGLKVVRHPDIEKKMYQRLGADVNEARLRMANVPQGGELLAAEALFAPIIKIRNVYIFPGIPKILQERFHAIKEGFREAPYFLKNVYVKYGEGVIAAPMNELVAQYPDLLLGSYPVLDVPEFKVKVTFESKDAAYLDRALKTFLTALPQDAVHRID